MHVALDRGDHDAAVVPSGVAAARFLLFDERHEVGNGALHDARGLHDLRQEHLAGAEQVADHVHARHQRAFDDVQRAGTGEARLLGVGLDVLVDPMDQGMLEALLDGQGAPRVACRRGGTLARLVAAGDRQQALGGIAAAVEDHVLDAFAQFGIEVVVDR